MKCAENITKEQLLKDSLKNSYSPSTPSGKIIEGSTSDLIKTIISGSNSLKKRSNIAVFDVDECLLWNNKDGSVSRRILVGELWDHLVNTGWKMYICTARDKTESSCQYVQDQLSGLGYANYGLVYMRPEGADVGIYKFSSRVRISEELNQKIGIMVGDQLTDIFPSGKAPVVISGGQAINSDKKTYIVSEPDSVTQIGIKLSEYKSRERNDI